MIYLTYKAQKKVRHKHDPSKKKWNKAAETNLKEQTEGWMHRMKQLSVNNKNNRVTSRGHMFIR